MHAWLCLCMTVTAASLVQHAIYYYYFFCNVLSFILYNFQDNTTALVAASFKGRTDVVELLIKHNADVNAKNKVRVYIIDNSCIRI